MPSGGVPVASPAAVSVTVAEIVKPHRLPPPLTDGQREEVRQRLAKYAFRPVADRPNSAAG
jgi:hypothetical protein